MLLVCCELPVALRHRRYQVLGSRLSTPAYRRLDRLADSVDLQFGVLFKITFLLDIFQTVSFKTYDTHIQSHSHSQSVPYTFPNSMRIEALKALR